MKKVFEQVKLGELTLKNRMVRSATWEAMADRGGHIPDELYKLYEELAQGGVGAIITGFTSVSDNAHLFGGTVRLSNDGLIDEHKKLTDICHKYNCPVIVQLALGEYNREENGRLIRNLDIDDMNEKDIKTVIEWFVNAAGRAAEAGYDGVQIHAAHFFLLSRFISPACNHRTDEYGGSTEKRSQIILDILKEIKKKWQHLHVTLKINSNDFTHGGLSAEESLLICKMCEKAGIDSIEVSGNGTSVSGIIAGKNEAYFKKFAIKLAEFVDIPVILVGGHRSLESMEAVLNEGKIEILSLSRPLVREPDLPNRWNDGDITPSKCVSCNMCYQTPGHKCIFNLREGK